MATLYRHFSGLADTDSQPSADNGVYAWCRYNAAEDNYTTDYPAYSLRINTPNFTNAGVIGGSQLLLNNQLCGSAAIQWASAAGPANNTRNSGPFKDVGGGGAFPATRNIAVLGVIDINKYEAEGNDYGTGDWTTTTGDVGYQFDTTSQSKLPGSVKQDPDTYNVIMPSTTVTQATPIGSTGRRLHWDVAVGELAPFVSKMRASGIGRVSNPFGGIPQASSDEELVAGWWLCQGYGLLLNGQLAFADYSAAP